MEKSETGTKNESIWLRNLLEFLKTPNFLTKWLKTNLFCIVARYISVHPKRDTCVFEFLAKLWANLELKMLQVFSEPEKVGHHLRI